MNKSQDKSMSFLQDHKRQKGEDYQEIQKLYRMCEKNKPSKVLKGFYIKFKNEDFSKQNLQSLIQEVSKRNKRNIKLLEDQEVDDWGDQRLVNFKKVYEEKIFDDQKKHPNTRRNHFYFIKQLIIEEMNYKEIKLLVNQDNNLKTIKSIKLPQVKTNNYEVQDLTKAKVDKVEKKIYNALKEFDPQKKKRQRPVIKVRKAKKKKQQKTDLSFQDNNDMLEDQITNDKNKSKDKNQENLLDPFETQKRLEKKVASQKRFDINKEEYDYALETEAHTPNELIKEVKMRNSIQNNLLRHSMDIGGELGENNRATFDPNQSFGENSGKNINLEDNMNDNLDALDKNVLAVDRKLANVQEHEDSVKKVYGEGTDEDSQNQIKENSVHENQSDEQLKKEMEQQVRESQLNDDSLKERPITAQQSLTSEELQKSQKSIKSNKDQQQDLKENNSDKVDNEKLEEDQIEQQIEDQEIENQNPKVEYVSSDKDLQIENDREKTPTFMGGGNNFEVEDNNQEIQNQINQRQIEDKLSDVQIENLNPVENVFLNNDDQDEDREYYMVDSENQIQTLTQNQQDLLNKEMNFFKKEK